MALDIVTSYQGFDHITADQLADFQRGLLGDSCILPVGSKMEVNIQTANQITVADGVAIYDGREIHIPYGTSENVAITSGTQGMLRNDIVCLQYNRDESSGVESVEFVTIAGTPVASDPQDPAYSNLDIRTGVFMSQKPFCRVRLNGTAIEGIDMLVETFDMGIYQLNKDLSDLSVQKTLWSGSTYLGENQTVNLTEPISMQKAGIILVWRRYNPGEGATGGYAHTFIPKTSPAIGSDTDECTEFLTNYTAGYVGVKTFYLQDSKITGHANNETGETKISASGLTTNNNRFALVKVLGC